jgi:hypothetical protein
VYPKGQVADAENHLSVYFRINRDFPVQAKFKVGVVDSTGTENFTHQYDHRFEKSVGSGWTKFVCRDDLLKPENGLLNYDTLTLSFEVFLK